MAQLSRFFTLYHAFHFAFILSYAYVRTLYPRSLVRTQTDYLKVSWENQIFLMLAIFLFRKYRASPTLDQFLESVLLFGKATVVALVVWTDYRVGSWYFMAWFMSYMTLRRPLYVGPAEVLSLTSSTFKSTIVKGDPDVTWVVLFTASWSDACSNLVPTFADVSVQFTTPGLRFARLDVSTFPEIAEEFNINTGGMSAQLPSIVLFENCREAKRLPPISDLGEVTRVSIDRPGLVAVFELERRMVDTANAKPKRR